MNRLKNIYESLAKTNEYFKDNYVSTEQLIDMLKSYLKIIDLVWADYSNTLRNTIADRFISLYKSVERRLSSKNKVIKLTTKTN